ncbi:MAG: hypothetical protein V3T17_12970 [Pseudomonadales bacterium]
MHQALIVDDSKTSRITLRKMLDKHSIPVAMVESAEEALEWAANLHEGYDYGEAPMSGERMLLLQGLVSQLSTAGFKGTVRLEGHVGEFCLSQIPLEDGGEFAMLPRPELPLSACNMIGTSTALAMQNSIQPSEAFVDFLADSNLMSATSPIRIELLPLGASSPQYAYPVKLEGLTTGDWNTVALNNNRVHIVPLPD